jgi:hypothetical protein
MSQHFSVSHIKEKFSYDPLTGVIHAKYLNGKPVGSKAGNGYINLELQGKKLLAHRVAWVIYYGDWPPGFVDHVNRDRSDNRIANLRQASRSQNHQNSGPKSQNATGFKGVSYRPRTDKYIAVIHRSNRQKYLGHFDTAEEAAAAYDREARVVHGEFAYQNFPEASMVRGRT